MMNKINDLFQPLVEKQSFGVCSRIGEKIGMSTSRIRLFFIYSSFLTLGSPLIVYLALAFWMDLKKVFKRSSIWEI